MDKAALTQLLTDLAAGHLSVAKATQALEHLPFSRVADVALPDHHRALRRGIPEAVYAPGKTEAQLVAIAQDHVRHGSTLLVTRVDGTRAEALQQAVPDGIYHALARAFCWQPAPFQDVGRGHVLVVAAGTSDLPVAEEAAVSLHTFGHRVERLTDVGVAGVHRILDARLRLEAAEVLVVVAGMEGALPTVVAGLTSRPVIGVPTSVGYGAAAGGIAALLGMLSSCAGGLTVVNIDNGFGAACAAALINRQREPG